MPFKVTKQYGRGADTFCADFSDLNDARQYIAEKIGPELAMNVVVTYRIYEFDEMIAEYDKQNASTLSNQPTEVDQPGGGGKGSGASFRPTPFNTAPRPKGSPQKWLHDEEDEKKEDEK